MMRDEDMTTEWTFKGWEEDRWVGDFLPKLIRHQQQGHLTGHVASIVCR